MYAKQILKQVIDFNKAVSDNTFKNLSIMQEPMEKVLGSYVEKTSGVNEESKKAMREWASVYKKGVYDFKHLVDDHFKRMETFFQ